jgi:hypothetical protein
MAESEVTSVLEQIQPGIDLLNTVAQGLEVIKGLIDGVSCPNWIGNLVLDGLGQSIKFISSSSTET